MKKHNYIVTVSRFDFYDIQVVKLLLFYDNENHSLDDITASVSSDWGKPSVFVVKDPDTYAFPNRIEMRWISRKGGRCFEIASPLDQAETEKLWERQEQDFPQQPFTQYVIGIAPHGGVAIWLCNDEKSILLNWLQAEERRLEGKEMSTHLPNPRMEEQVNAIMFPQKLQSNMRQHRYRFVPLEEFFDGEQWVVFESSNAVYEGFDLVGIEVKRLDGSFDYTLNQDLMQYHMAGKPQRITVRWKNGKASYFAHFWLDEETVTIFFNSFFNKFPDASADLLLRIDTQANCYEVAMTAEGVPVRTLKNTQYIVFKNYKEICHSENYTKKDGEWRWL